MSQHLRAAAPCCKNIRLCSYVANALSGGKNYEADGDGCVGLHMLRAARRWCTCLFKGVTVERPEASTVRIGPVTRFNGFLAYRKQMSNRLTF